MRLLAGHRSSLFLGTLRMIRSMHNRTTENNTLHPRAILTEPEDELREYEKFTKDLGRLIEEPEIVDRKFEASTAEWEYVRRLTEALPPLVPEVPIKENYPSGFRLPVRKYGDLPYHIHRTNAHMLPVYLRCHKLKQLVETRVRRVDGNLFALRDELDELLYEKYRMKFISQVAELYGRVTYRGDFEKDFKEFLLNKGF